LTGSSPRTRGILSRSRVVLHASRFIPACAGNTGHRPGIGMDRSVHPRARGEY